MSVEGNTTPSSIVAKATNSDADATPIRALALFEHNTSPSCVASGPNSQALRANMNGTSSTLLREVKRKASLGILVVGEREREKISMKRRQ